MHSLLNAYENWTFNKMQNNMKSSKSISFFFTGERGISGT